MITKFAEEIDDLFEMWFGKENDSNNGDED